MGLLTAFVSITDARAQSELLLDPYAREPIPVGAPVWMQDIAKDPTGVNYHKMDSLFTLWQAADNDARVKTPDRKPAVNYYRQWMKAYRPCVGTDGYIHLPTVKEYIAKLERQNKRTASWAKTRAATAESFAI